MYRGDTETVRALATSGTRRQLGLKLRAENGCNVIYVMWRLDPRPKLEVSVKRNPGATDHEACGAEGYTKVRPTRAWPVPVLAVGDHAHAAGGDLRGRADRVDRRARGLARHAARRRA